MLDVDASISVKSYGGVALPRMHMVLVGRCHGRMSW